MVFNALSNALLKSATTAIKNYPPQFSERSTSNDDEYYQEDEGKSNNN